MALAENPLDDLREYFCGRVLVDSIQHDDTTWLVGGAVRDLLLGLKPDEFDLVTTDSAIGLAEELGTVVENYERFGTATATDGGCTFDVAEARTETYASPGALPEVTLGATIEEDLARRDFTVNAIAMRFGSGGPLLAHPGALSDLDAGVMRVLHDKSFEDDPTRLWRLVRYSVRLDFKIDRHTSELAAAAVAGGALDTISGDRIGTELRLALNEPDSLAALHAAQNLGLTPQLKLDPATIGSALEILPTGARADLLILGSSVPDDKWIAGLGFTADELATLRKTIAAPAAPDGKPSVIAAALRGLPDEAVALAGARGNRKAAERWLLELRDIKLEIDGDDLLATGLQPGPEIGERLARVLDRKLDGEISGRDDELMEALR